MLKDKRGGQLYGMILKVPGRGLKGKFIKVVTLGKSSDCVLIFMFHCGDVGEKFYKCHHCGGGESGRNQMY